MNDYRYIPGDEAILAPLSDEERKAIAVHVAKSIAGKKGGKARKAQMRKRASERKHADKWVPYNTKRNKRLKALALAGVPYKQIAAQENLSPITLYNLFGRRKLGLPVNSPTLAFHSSAGRTSCPQYTGKPLNNGVA